MYEQLLQNLAFPLILWPHLKQYVVSVFLSESGRVNDAIDVHLEGI